MQSGEQVRTSAETARRVVRAFSARFLAVVLSLAALAVFSQVTLVDLIDTNRDSGARVNISGRQRMLSQRISMLANELAATPEELRRRELRDHLTASIDLMEESHRALLVDPGMSAEQRARYFGPTSYVDRDVTAYLDLARAVATTDVVTEQVSLLRIRREGLLKELDAVVQRYQWEAENLQDRLRLQATAFTILTLVVLAASALVVFRPLVRRVGDEMVEISRSRAELRAVLDSAQQGVVVTDARARILSVNPMFTKITGYEASEVLGKSPAVLKSGRHDDAFFRSMWEQLTHTGSWLGEVWNRRKNGDVYPQSLSISTVRGQDGLPDRYVGMFSDITERKRSEEAVWRRANYDELTHLPKRSLLHDRLQIALASARRSRRHVGVLFVDLDGFKPINDSLGHRAGDEVLVEVGRRLLASVREADTVSRVGGDEFVLALPDIDSKDIEQFAERILKSLREPFWWAGTRLNLSASVGVAVFSPDGEETPQLLMERADHAMYKAKRLGGGAFALWSPDLAPPRP